MFIIGRVGVREREIDSQGKRGVGWGGKGETEIHVSCGLQNTREGEK